jgi:hypothetical protein
MVKEASESNNDEIQTLPESVEAIFFAKDQATSHSSMIEFPAWETTTPFDIVLKPEHDEIPVNQDNLPGVNQKPTGEWPIVPFTIRSSSQLDVEIKIAIQRSRKLLDDYGVILLRPNNLPLQDDAAIGKILLGLKHGPLDSIRGSLYEHVYKQLDPSSTDTLLYCRTRVELTPKEKGRNPADPTHELIHGMKQISAIPLAPCYEPVAHHVEAVSTYTNIPREVIEALLNVPPDPQQQIKDKFHPLVIRKYSCDVQNIVNAINPEMGSLALADYPLAHAFYFLGKRGEFSMDLDEPTDRQDDLQMDGIRWHCESGPAASVLHVDTRYTYQTSQEETYAPVYTLSLLLYGEFEPRNWVLLNRKQKGVLAARMLDELTGLIIPPVILTTCGIPFIAGRQKKGDIVVTAPGTIWHNWGRCTGITLEKKLLLDGKFRVPSQASDDISKAFLALAEEMDHDRDAVIKVWEMIDAHRLTSIPSHV